MSWSARRLAEPVIGPAISDRTGRLGLRNDRSAMTAAIAVSHLYKIYAGGFQALKDINLEIRRGEIFGLLGPNGAGKTTLISIICGIVNPTARQARCRGPRHHHRLPRRALADRAGAAGAHDRRVHLAVVDGVVQPRPVRQARQRGLPREDTQDLSLWDKRNDKIMTLSGGMKRRRDDRQGAVARTAHPLPRRADRRRRRRAAQGHVGDGARRCAPRA